MKDFSFEKNIIIMSENDLGSLYHTSVTLQVYYQGVGKQKQVDRELYIQKMIKQELKSRE